MKKLLFIVFLLSLFINIKIAKASIPEENNRINSPVFLNINSGVIDESTPLETNLLTYPVYTAIPEGDYTIGATECDYTTITSALSDLKTRGISGAVRFLLKDTLYPSETYPLRIDSIPGSSASNTFTLKPYTGVSVLIKKDTAVAIFEFNQCKYVTIDGSNGSKGRNLTIFSNNTGGKAILIKNDASYNTIINTVICGAASSTTSGIVQFSTTSNATGCDFNTIENCKIWSDPSGPGMAYNGIYFYGTNSKYGERNKILNNTITNFTNNAVFHDVYYRYTEITGNDIYEEYPAYSSQITGIWINSVCVRMDISKNKFHDFLRSLGGTERGIYVYNCTSDTINIFNNIFYFYASYNYAAVSIYAITNYSASNFMRVFNNVIYIGGSSGEYSSDSRCINITYSNYDTLYNNIFYNARSGTGTYGKHYVFYLGNAGYYTTFFSNYNNVYVSGANGFIGYSGGDKATLANWITATGRDKQSYSSNPNFLSYTTYLIDTTNSNCWDMYKKGMPVPIVSADYRGLIRSTTVTNGPTCMGPYEFSTNTEPPVATASGVPSANDTTEYSQANRKLFEIIWGASDVPDALPITVSLKYYSGSTPPDTGGVPVAKIGKGYWYFDTDKDPSNTINIKVFWGNQELGNITDTSKIILAMYDMKSKIWQSFPRGTSGSGYSIINHSDKSITVNGLSRIDSVRFALTDKDYPLSGFGGPIAGGDYTVGTSSRGDFSTITEAVNAANSRGVSGAVRFLLIDNSYPSETFPITIGNISGTTSTNTVTIKPSTGKSPVITGSNPDALIILNNARYIIIDGSNTTGGITKDLLIYNTNNASIKFTNDAKFNIIKNDSIMGNTIGDNGGIIRFMTDVGTTGCDSNTISNCAVRSGSTVAYTLIGVNWVVAGVMPDYILIENCNLAKMGQHAIYAFSNTGYWMIKKNNIFLSGGNDSYHQYLVYLNGGDNHRIDSNNIGGSNPDRSGAPISTPNDVRGIQLNVGKIGTTNIQGNKISNLGTTGTYTGLGNITAILIEEGKVDIGTEAANIIGGGSSVFDTLGGIGSIYGIQVSSTAGHVNIKNNTIGNFYSSSTENDEVEGIYIGISPDSVFIENNSIRDLYSKSTYTTAGIYGTGGGSWDVKRNLVYNISNTRNDTAAVNVYGMYFGKDEYTNYLRVTRNKIYGISASGTGLSGQAPNVCGIYATGNNVYIINSMITINGLTNDQKIRGMEIGGKYNSDYVLDNSVFIGGTSTGGGNNTYSFLRSDTAVIMLMNNIFYNYRTGGAGIHYAVGNTASAPSAGWYSQASNYNFFITPNQTYMGEWGSGTSETYNNWRTASNGDLNSYYLTTASINYAEFFNDVSVGNLDIININAKCWFVNGKGLPILGLEKDYDGNSRNMYVTAGTVDIGANEFTTSTTPPVSVANGSPSPGGTTNYKTGFRKLIEVTWGTSKEQINNNAPDALPTTVSVQYFSGETPPDTGFMPVAKTGKVYWYIDSDGDPANTVNFKVYWGDNELGNITDTSKLVLAMYDMKSRKWKTYYRGFSGNSVSIINHSEKSITLNGISRVDSIRFALTSSDQPLTNEGIPAGDYTIGFTGCDYQTITQALYALRTRGVDGTVRFLLTDTLYNLETFPLVIDSIPGSSASNTVTFKPYPSVNPKIQATYAGALIEFDKCRYVIIDGSNGSKGQNLTISNLSTSGQAVMFKNNSSYDTIKSTIISGANSSEYSGIIHFGTTTSATGCDYNVIKNCIITGVGTFATNNIYLSGTAGKPGRGNKIINNFITNFNRNGVFFDVYYYNTEITGNNFYHSLTPNYSATTGIWIQGRCSRIDISRNKIHDLTTNGSGGMLRGIYLWDFWDADTINIYNNLIYLSHSLSNIYGIYNNNRYSNFTKSFNNLIIISGICDNQTSSYCFYAGLYHYDSVYNNIFCNTRSNTVNGYGKQYVFYSNYLAAFNSNNNNTFFDGTGGLFGWGETADRNTLTEWVAATGMDKNSYFSNPDFISGEYLIDSTNSSCWNEYGKGKPFPLVSDDYRGLPRSTTSQGGPVCIGPYEFTTTTNPPSATASGTPVSNDTTFYYQSGRELLEILWGSSDDNNNVAGPFRVRIKNQQVAESFRAREPKALPTTVNVQYFSGVTLPDTAEIPVAKTGAGYWKVDTDYDPASPYNIKIYWGDQELGNIPNTGDMTLAMYDMKNRVWLPFDTASSGTGFAIKDNTNKTIIVNGLTRIDSVCFALTSLSHPLKRLRLDLNLIIAGFWYDRGSGYNTMRPDTVAAIIRTTNPWTVIDTLWIFLDSSGYGYGYSGLANIGTGYFIEINHRNSLSTWSSDSTTGFSRVVGTKAFDFTYAQTQAYGSNLIQVGTKWCIINGDVSRDDWIDGSDYLDIFNNYDTGGEFMTPDTNGDDWIDGSDYLIIFNNYDIGALNPITGKDILEKSKTKIQNRIQNKIKEIKELLNKNK